MIQIHRKTVLVGIYAGRSGSKSFVGFLNRQPGIHVTWEQSGLLQIPALNRPEIKIQEYHEDHHRFSGDFDPCWLWALQHVINDWNVRIVYLYRDPEEIAHSFWTYMHSKEFESEDRCLTTWPFCNYEPSVDGILRTVRQYQAEVDMINAFFPNRIIRVDLADFNDMSKMDHFLDQIGLQKQGRMLSMEKIRSWAKQRQAEENTWVKEL